MKRHLEKIVLKRTYRNIRSRLKKRIRDGAQFSKAYLKKYHLLRNKYDLGLQGHNKPSHRSTLEISIPVVLSLSENPIDTMGFISALKKKLSDDFNAYDLFIDHQDSRVITIDVSFLFDKIISDYVNKWKKKRVFVKLSGRSAKSRAVNNFLLSFGFFSTIKILAKQLCPSDADSDYSKHFIIFRKFGSSTQPYLAGNACTELTDFFDKCFNDNGFKIIDEAKGNLIDTFGEIIKNAEEHSGGAFNGWNVIGCYSRSTHTCSFSIINYGRSFYDSLSSSDSTAFTALSEIDDIVLKHRSLFSKLLNNRALYEENIWTMMALQDGISSKRTVTGRASSRGQGMMDIMTFIDGIRNKSSDKNSISIVSGFTSIVIDFSFPISTIPIPNTMDQRRMMIFNSEHDLHMMPDSKYITNIKDKFPGVIISGSFVIDSAYLTEKLNGGKNAQ